MSGVKYRFQRIYKFYAVASQIAIYVYFNLAVKRLRVSFGRHAKLPRVFLAELRRAFVPDVKNYL